MAALTVRVAVDTTRDTSIRLKSTARRLILASVALLAAGAPAYAATCEGPASNTQLTVRVTSVPAAKGEMAVTIYPDDARRFLAPKGRLLRVRPPATSPVTTTCFNLPGPGHYAIAVYHDANGDRDFNRTMIGMPAEDYGFSNDAPTTVGLPSFRSVRFSVAPGKNTTSITLKRH